MSTLSLGITSIIDLIIGIAFWPRYTWYSTLPARVRKCCYETDYFETSKVKFKVDLENLFETSDLNAKLNSAWLKSCSSRTNTLSN